MRKLASVRKISKLSPIAGADKIELAHIDGWKCVTQKGNFKEGDLCVYFEIDAFLPIRPELEFLRKNCYKNHPDLGEGFRIRTIKLRGQISQGLALPIKDMSWIDLVAEEGTDLTEILGVQKYEIPIPVQMAGVIRGNFPSFIPKTDAERIQNVYREFESERKLTWKGSFKYDGSSCTMYIDDEGEFHVCSRNLDLKEDDNNIFWKTAKKYPYKNLLEFLNSSTGEKFAIQGELIGPGIQDNPHKKKENSIVLFDIYNVTKQEYVAVNKQKYIFKVFGDLVGANHLVIAEGELFFFFGNKKDEASQMDWLLKMADESKHEGYVFRCCQDSSKRFKVISNNWLLEHE